MSIVGSVPELDCEPFFCNCISSGVVNNGDRHLSEHDDGGECLILEADDCACCVLKNGDGDLSESEDDGVYLILDADDCTFCVPKNEDEDLSESEDDVLLLISDAADGACDWVQLGDGVSIKMWQSSFLCNVKYEIHTVCCLRLCCM